MDESSKQADSAPGLFADGTTDYATWELAAEAVPVFYSSQYNIRFLGLEKLHPFDSTKYERTFKLLQAEADAPLPAGRSVAPPLISEQQLAYVHTAEYLKSLSKSATIARITEIPIGILPNFLLQRFVLNPMRCMTAGTILAAKAALRTRWAINLGGGFHHAHSKDGGGFCVYADITLAIRYLRSYGFINRAMVVDLDAHQGNGHERDFQDDPLTQIVDLFNDDIYPGDGPAKRAIDVDVRFHVGAGDAQYLARMQDVIPEALDRFSPDFVLYNAGTDTLDGDPLGLMHLSADAIKQRDQLMFQWCKDRDIPVVMVLSGGYQRSNAAVIAASLINLNKRFDLWSK